MEKAFKQFKGSVGVGAVIAQINQQKYESENLVERALNGDVTETEAVAMINDINKASVSLRAVVAGFSEIHKDSATKEKKTLSDAIETLDAMSNRFKITSKLI